MMRKSKDNLWRKKNLSKKEGRNFNNKTNDYFIVNNKTKKKHIFNTKNTLNKA